jgi:SWI/SNF-related matrix-associated actin-dependent regulator of chromatin subfamily A member 5
MAYHWEYLRIQGPHLICVPKSTLSNWMNELERWCPSLRVIKFHGSREEREELIENYFTNNAAAHDGRRPDKPQIRNEKGELVDDNSDNPRQWDVCVSTYEVANTERKVLQKFIWRYLIIDEAHRLKNDASMFSKTVRSFKTSNRLLLTGYVSHHHVSILIASMTFSYYSSICLPPASVTERPCKIIFTNWYVRISFDCEPLLHLLNKPFPHTCMGIKSVGLVELYATRHFCIR